MATTELSLKTAIAHLLSQELGTTANVLYAEHQITIFLRGETYENNFGNMLQQIHRVTDKTYLERGENIFILMQFEQGFQHRLKIWKSVYKISL